MDLTIYIWWKLSPLQVCLKSQGYSMCIIWTESWIITRFSLPGSWLLYSFIATSWKSIANGRGHWKQAQYIKRKGINWFKAYTDCTDYCTLWFTFIIVEKMPRPLLCFDCYYFCVGPALLQNVSTWHHSEWTGSVSGQSHFESKDWGSAAERVSGTFSISWLLVALQHLVALIIFT